MLLKTHICVTLLTTLALVGCNGEGNQNATPNLQVTPTEGAQVNPTEGSQVNATGEAGAGGSITPAVSTINSGEKTEFTVTADNGFIINSVAGCSGSLSGDTFTTGTLNDNCVVSATFTPLAAESSTPLVTVNGSASLGGSINPVSQVQVQGTPASLTVTPDAGFVIGEVSGCSGSLSGNTYTTGIVDTDCAVSATFTPLVIGSSTSLVTVGGQAGTGGTITPGSQTKALGTVAVLTVTPDPGFVIGRVIGCSGRLLGNTFKTGTLNTDCVVSATFKPLITVTANASAGGSITPATQTQAQGSVASLTVSPASGFHLGTVTGCNGSLSGLTFTTGPLTADCAVSATFIERITVTSNAGAGGSITPSSTIRLQGTMATLTVTPDTGFSIAAVTGCRGSLSGNTYTTGILNTNCTVSATFAQQITVSGSAGANGSITPTSQTKDSGTVASLTVTPDTGFVIDSVSGCGGTLSGNTYNTSALVADCSITASFTELFTVTASATGSGTISPATQEIQDGDTTTLTVTPNSGSIVESISGCGIALDSGTSYTTAAITADCAVSVNFAARNRIAAGGYSSCTILGDGNAKCWGQNSSGQLGVAAFSLTAHGDEAGEGPVTNTTIDLPDVTLTIDSLSIGTQHACAILNDKNLYCWGEGQNGQTGLGINTDVSSMTKVDLSDAAVAEVSAGGQLTCARLANNTVKCWGRNSSGELGLGTADAGQNTPTTAVNFTGVDLARITTGAAHACALLANNTVMCWGDNSSGQLGDSDGGNDSNVPSSVTLPGGTVRDIDSGNLFSCVIIDSNVYCWGENGSGQLGNNDGTNTDLDVLTAALDIDGSTPKKLALGGEHACVLTTVGTVYCWGESDAGQTGQNDTTDDLAPLIVDFGAYTVTDISAGNDHTCVALLPDNAGDTERPIRCWGEGGVGQLGLEDTSDLGDDEVIDNIGYNLVF